MDENDERPLGVSGFFCCPSPKISLSIFLRRFDGLYFNAFLDSIGMWQGDAYLGRAIVNVFALGLNVGETVIHRGPGRVLSRRRIINRDVIVTGYRVVLESGAPGQQ